MKKIKWSLLSIFVLITLFLWIYIINETPSDELTVSFLDVGQGDAIFIEAPNHNQVLIDGGNTSNEVLRQLRDVMPFYDRSIDLVIATHPDNDHIGGLVSIIDRFFIGMLIKTDAVSNTNIYKELLKEIEENNIETINAKAGYQIYLDEDIVLEIFYPDRDVIDMEANTGSIVILLSYLDSNFIFTGDSPKSIENYLISLYGESLKAKVLKVGHHGSKTSSSLEFISIVNPEYAIISAGEDNQYGHPHEEVLETLKQFEIDILNTSKVGTITFVSDGSEIKLK